MRKTNFAPLFCLLASLAFLLSCNQDETAFGPQDGQAFESIVAGRVTDRNGKPLSGALVTALPGGATTVTGPDGVFTLAKLAAGSYRIALAKDDYLDTLFLDSVRIGLSVKRDIGALGMRYRYATIKGVVEDSSGTGQPTAAIAVEDQMPTTMAMNGGRFTLGRVEPGRVRLFTAIQGLGYGSLDTVLKADDTLKDVKLRILHKGGAVTGQVVGNDGKGIQGAQVQTVGGALKTVTDGSGNFRITEVPGGGKVVVEIVKGEMSTVVTGVRVAEGSKTDLSKIAIVELSSSETVSIRAGLAMAMTTDSVAMLVADTVSEDSTFRILRYLWSLDNGNTWDTTSTNLFKVFLKRLGWSSGSHPVLVKVVSADGKISATGTITVRLMLPPDWNAPNIVRSSPKQDTTRLWKDSLMTFAWNVGDDRKLDSVWIDGKAVAGSASVFSRQVALKLGRNAYALVARDSAGNVARDSIFVTRRDRDTINPMLAHVTPLRDTVYAYGDSFPKTVSWKVTDAGGLDSVWLDGVGVKPDTAGKVAKSLTIPAGKSVVVRVRARDQDGNEVQDSVALTRRASSADTLAIPGLVAYWPFNGDAKDASGNGNDGTVRGAKVSTNRFGRDSAAYIFNGLSDWIEGVSDKLPGGERTVSLWFNAEDLSGGRFLVSYGGGQMGTSWLMVLNNQSQGLNSYEMQGHNQVNRINGPYTKPPVNGWYHFCVSTSSAGTKLYVNDSLLASNGIFVNNTGVKGKTFAIGTGTAPDGTSPYSDQNATYFKGRLDDIRIYDRALTEVEIRKLFKEGGWTGNVSPARADTGLAGTYFDMESPVTPPSLVREAGGYSDQAVFPWPDGAYNGFAEVATSDSAHLNGGRSLRLFLDNYGGSGGNSFQKTGINLHPDTGYVWTPSSDTISYWMTDVDYTTSSRWAWGQGMALVTAQGPVMVWNRCATWGGGEHCMGLGDHPGSSYGFDDAADSVIGSDGRRWRLYRVVVPDSLRGGKVKEVLFHAHQASWDGTRARSRFFLDRVTGLSRTARTKPASVLTLANLTVTKGILSPSFRRDSLAYRDTIVDSLVVVSAWASDSIGSSVWIDGVKRNSATIAPSYSLAKRVRVVVRSNTNGDSLVHVVDVYRRDLDPPRFTRVMPERDTSYSLQDTEATVSWIVSDAQSGLDTTWIDGKLVWPDASGKVASVIPLVAGATKKVYLRVKDHAGLVSVDSLKLTRAGAAIADTTFGIPLNSTIAYGVLHDDRDGQEYRTVSIGGRNWMAENLNLRDTGAGGDTVGACYNDMQDSCRKYGRMYRWTDAMAGAVSSSRTPSGVRGLCPAGWHLPSDAEWDSLAKAAGGSNTAGGALKSTSGWNSSGSGSDNYGFRAIPAGSLPPLGYRFMAGNAIDAGSAAVYWSSTVAGSAMAWRRRLASAAVSLERGDNGDDNWYSIRCLEDYTPAPQDTTLASLTVSKGALSPAFVKTTTIYADTVTDSLVRIEAHATDASVSTVSIDGQTQDTLTVALAPGETKNVIIKVASKDADFLEYNVEVYRSKLDTGANLLVNGDFAAGNSDWLFYLGGSGSNVATVDYSSGSATVSISATDSTTYGISLSQSGFALDSGAAYVLEFTASASSGRDIEINYSEYLSPYRWIANATIALTATKQSYSKTLTMPSGTTAGKLQFLLGKSPAGIVIDDVSLRRLGK